MQIMRVLKPVSLWCAVLVILGWVANGLWVVHVTDQYGGGALTGFVRDGHYYLEHYGSYTVTSRAIWEDVRLHELAVSVGAPVVFACFAYLLLGAVLPWMTGLRRGEAVAERVRAVRASGMRLAYGSGSGSVAGFSLNFPAALGIELYSGGLTVRVLLEPTVAILKEELRRIEVPKGLFGPRVEIDYRSPDVRPPLRLYSAGTTDLVVALGRFMESTETRSE